MESFGGTLQRQAGGKRCKSQKYFKPVHGVNTAEKSRLISGRVKQA
jgi:hypothetical protein